MYFIKLYAKTNFGDNMTNEKTVIINEKAPTDLLRSDFYYDLPEELIAQHPMEKRDESRLMVLSREKGSIDHKHFYDILDYLRDGDVLVVNDSKVIPARIYGHAENRPGAPLELLLLRQRDLDTWECLVKPGKRAKLGAVIIDPSKKIFYEFFNQLLIRTHHIIGDHEMTPGRCSIPFHFEVCKVIELCSYFKSISIIERYGQLI